MKVLVDATMLDGGPCGAATRLASLGAALAERGRVEVVHLVRPGVDPLPGLCCVPFTGSTTPLSRALAGRRLRAEAVRRGAALVQLGALPVPRLPCVLTVHDLRWLDDPEGSSLPRRLWARHALARNLARAGAIVAVSRTTATALVERGLAPAERVVVVPNAGSPGLRRVEDPGRIAAFRRRLGLNARYVLALGPVGRHKGTPLVLAALAAARRSAGDLGLVLAGRVDPALAVDVARAARELDLPDVVRLTGPLTKDELAVALSGADALVCAGRAEGFAIPVVDAQLCGIPVVAVNAAALPETVGDGGWLAEPGALGSALVAAITPGEEQQLRLARGRVAATRWSWQRSAGLLEELWERCSAEAHFKV